MSDSPDFSSLTWQAVVIIVAVLGVIAGLYFTGHEAGAGTFGALAGVLLLQLLGVKHSAEAKSATQTIAAEMNGKLTDTIRDAFIQAIDSRSIVEEPFRPPLPSDQAKEPDLWPAPPTSSPPSTPPPRANP